MRSGELDVPLYHHLLRSLVFQFRLCSIEYFMDYMAGWELNDYIDYLPHLDRNSWEQARLAAYTTAQVNSTQTIAMTDICRFKWDTENEEEAVTAISNDDVARLSAQAKAWESIIRDK